MTEIIEDAVIAHLSDVHVGKHSEEDLKEILEHVQEISPHVIVLTGDICDTPSKQRLLDANKFLGDLSELGPVVACLGNHDMHMAWGNRIPFLSRLLKGNGRAKRQFHSYLQPRHFSELDLLIVPIDTNGGVAAQGQFNPAELRDIQSYLANNPAAANAATKIALLHHHPLPVLKSRSGGLDELLSRAGGVEAYTLMRDAAKMVSALMELEFSIVLHGHEHVSGDWNVGSTSMSGGADSRTLIVSYTGPASLIEDTARVSKLSLARNGVVEKTDYVRTADNPKFHATDSTRLGRAPRSNAKPKFAAHHYSRAYVIDEFGDALSETSYVHLSSSEDQSALPIRMKFESGGMSGAPRVTGKWSRTRRQIEITRIRLESAPADGGVTYEGELRFNPPLHHDSEVSASFAVDLNNAVAITSDEWKLNHEGPETATEFIGAIVPPDFAVGVLEMSVRFPSPGYLALIEDSITVQSRHHDQPDERETRRVESDLIVHAAAGLVRITVSDPIPGSSYRINWTCPDRDKVEATLPYVSDLTRSRLAIRNGRNSTSSAREIVERVLEHPEIQNWFGESLEASLATIHEDGRLRTLHVSNDTIGHRAFRVGEGVAGRALKTGDVCVHCPMHSDEGHYRSFEGQDELHSCLVSIPLHFPHKRSGLIWCVVSIGCMSERSTALEQVRSRDERWLSHLERIVFEAAIQKISDLVSPGTLEAGAVENYESYATSNTDASAESG